MFANQEQPQQIEASREVQFSIPARFNGPVDSGNGGYSSGVLAVHVGPTAKVRLASPPPLDTPLTVHSHPSRTGETQLLQGEHLIATAWPAVLDIDVPTPPTLEQARQATLGFIGHKAHALPHCYVCGPERSADDGMHLFAGPVAGSEVYACPWSPLTDQLDHNGEVKAEFVWAALDCPGYFAAFGAEPRMALLGELTADLRVPLNGDEEHVVFAWSMGQEGRKRFSGTAIANAAGDVAAVARATWIELKKPQAEDA